MHSLPSSLQRDHSTWTTQSCQSCLTEWQPVPGPSITDDQRQTKPDTDRLLWQRVCKMIIACLANNLGLGLGLCCCQIAGPLQRVGFLLHSLALCTYHLSLAQKSSVSILGHWQSHLSLCSCTWCTWTHALPEPCTVLMTSCSFSANVANASSIC